MAIDTQKIGWIGTGRMGFPIAESLLKAGYAVSVWNRTRAKAEPLAKLGGTVVDKVADLAGVDVLFSMISTKFSKTTPSMTLWAILQMRASSPSPT